MAHRINRSHYNFDGNFAFKGDGGASFGEDKLGDTRGDVDIGTLDGVLPTAAFFPSTEEHTKKSVYNI